MTNYLYVKNVLEKADTPLSGDQIWYRAKKSNKSLSRSRVSTILQTMKSKGVASFDVEQVSKRRMKFWYLL